MSPTHPYSGLTKRLAILCDIGRVWTALAEVPPPSESDPLPIGYRRVLEARAVRDMTAPADFLDRAVRETPEFRKNFQAFNLDANEGYLLSLVAGRLSVRKILMISSLGRFPTLLALAKLQQKGVIVFEKDDPDSSALRRRP